MRIVRASENRYIAYDEANRKTGVCYVERRELPRVFPDCPVQIEIDVQARDESRDVLYGAAVTRARVLASGENGLARIYAVVDPMETESLRVLEQLGFERRDGIVRMSRPTRGPILCGSLPEGTIIIQDDLAKEDEKLRCLKRYNECFGENKDLGWLENMRAKTGFKRIIAVSNGLRGEILLWNHGTEGVIGTVQVPVAYRRQGIATCLMEQARQYFAESGALTMNFDAWRRSPGCWQLAQKAEFVPVEMIVEYPELRK